MSNNYSVLMSVYYKEKPENLEEAMDSMFNQTMPTNDFVLVCDGPLTPELDAVIEKEKKAHKEILNVVRLPENKGLGNALNIGLNHCKNEFVARMDSDDVSEPYRCELEYQTINNGYDIVSGTVTEISKDISKKRILPENDEEIKKFSKYRNPFNHPATMLRIESVINAGSYSEEFHLFEDYYLWIRMFLNNCKAYNINKNLVNMRFDDNTYQRRGGKTYAKDMLKLYKWMLDEKWINVFQFMTIILPRVFICVLPLSVRRFIYNMSRK